MFDTTLISRKGKYIYRGESLKFSHTDESKRGGTIFVFKNKKGTWKRITQTNCQKELWEEIITVPTLQ